MWILLTHYYGTLLLSEYYVTLPFSFGLSVSELALYTYNTPVNFEFLQFFCV